MKRTITVIAIALIIVSAVSASRTVYAKGKATVYRVTITNITMGQIISPPIVISHNEDFHLFRLAHPATAGLALLAEEGMTSMLATELGGSDSVYRYAMAGGGIMPGASVTVEIETRKGYSLLSAAGMLISSNDAFFAVRGVKARSKGNMTVVAQAYDAGSELNTESCDSVPGPPCAEDSGNMRNTEGAEDYVYIHSGIHGIADLDPAEFDWHNPVATVMIQRVKR